VVGKGPESEPPIDLDTMIELTAAAEVNGARFDGVDIFLSAPHVDIESSDDDLKVLAEKLQAKGLDAGTLVAPVWPPTGGGSAMGTAEERSRFVDQVRKACRIGQKLREFGVRPYGSIRIDSAVDPVTWSEGDSDANSRLIAATFREACEVAADCGERLAAEGEICWGGMHSWKQMVKLLELVDRPDVLGYQADIAHNLLYLLGYNSPEDSILPRDWDWDDQEILSEAWKTLTAALRPWTIDVHIAQNDATVKGSGSHDKTGRHCLPNDPNGKIEVVEVAGYWLRHENGDLTKTCRHLCWDGCMFANEIMMQPQTWDDILATMIAVRDSHGWQE
jgi:hypothetical protein